MGGGGFAAGGGVAGRGRGGRVEGEAGHGVCVGWWVLLGGRGWWVFYGLGRCERRNGVWGLERGGGSFVEDGGLGGCEGGG